MINLQITLPDALAREAASAGLLAPAALERMLREQLRKERIDKMQEARDTLAADPMPPMTPDEINAEIGAYRNAQRRAPGS